MGNRSVKQMRSNQFFVKKTTTGRVTFKVTAVDMHSIKDALEFYLLILNHYPTGKTNKSELLWEATVALTNEYFTRERWIAYNNVKRFSLKKSEALMLTVALIPNQHTQMIELKAALLNVL